MENYLQVSTPAGLMSVFCSSPAGIGKKNPVVIVLQEAFGVNEHIKDVCRRLSSQGYLALAPELYHRTMRHLVIDYGDKEKMYPELEKLRNNEILQDLNSLVKFLPELPSANKEDLFLLGFCMGGFAALLGATEFRLKGSVSFYGAGVVRRRDGIGLTPFVQELAKSKCPLLLFYGEKDVSIPAEDRHLIQTVLDSNHIPHTLLLFPEADHGFFCNQRKVYNEDAAQLAWVKTLDFLQRHSSTC